MSKGKIKFPFVVSDDLNLTFTRDALTERAIDELEKLKMEILSSDLDDRTKRHYMHKLNDEHIKVLNYSKIQCVVTNEKMEMRKIEYGL